ncbi:hypothetical protein EZJ58_2883 [Sodalis ligni]|uniref:Uncharacterized protein n=1 Tax=Sodalis ligni TaxID=2697027 RepID=A0A4R1ND28_9GAMM|nr:hypothetical protein EZJ58_2883 [Sodalis ligni]
MEISGNMLLLMGVSLASVFANLITLLPRSGLLYALVYI